VEINIWHPWNESRWRDEQNMNTVEQKLELLEQSICTRGKQKLDHAETVEHVRKKKSRLLTEKI
jgi:hypothetical protein